MSGDVVAVLMIFGVHLIALGVIVGPLAHSALRENDDPDGSGPTDEDGGGGSRRPEVGPTRPRPLGDLPLPDATPARLRLREPGRLADAYDGPPRRGPAPAPSRRIRR